MTTPSIRETAIENARRLAQDIFAETYLPGRQAYYVERDGRITKDEFVGNYHERQSVYFGEVGHAMRLITTGTGSVGYNGDDSDYLDEAGNVLDYRILDIDHPSDEMVERIKAIEHGFFDDETETGA